MALVLIAGCGQAAAAPHKVKKPVAAEAVVQTGTVTVNGTSESVLTDTSGRTLYYFTPDAPNKIACTASALLPDGKACTAVWPPLLATASTLKTPASVTGALGVYTGPNGRQVEYNGHPLYIFSGDTGPDQSHGEGLLGKWFVATPSLATATAKASPSPSASSGGGSGY